MSQPSPFAAGLQTLGHPILPLIRLVQLLYLTGPFATVAEILPELREPIETNAATYDDPPRRLQPYLEILQQFEGLKDSDGLPHPAYRIVDEQGAELAPFEALELWVNHQALRQELAGLNSQLCAPCHCHLCCLGPEAENRQQFFEIPLLPQEVAGFPLPRVDSGESRATSALAEPSLRRDHQPFYQTAAALYRWRTGWSLILPRASACPNLEKDPGGCRIYPERPEVCRQPQIFPYLLERRPELDRPGAETRPTYLAPRKLLAIWDCPYVRQFQAEIAAYAEQCELEPIFKKNKE